MLKVLKILGFIVAVGLGSVAVATYTSGKTSKKRRLVAANSAAKSTYSKTKASAPKSDSTLKKDIDDEITNAKMRAEAGSKSRFSISGSLSYNGASIKQPFGPEAPNPQKLTGAQKPEVDASGDLSLRMRINQNLSSTLGGGWRAVKPLHGAEQQEFVNPTGSLDASYTLGKIQASTSLSAIVYTQEAYRDQGYLYGYSFNQVFLSPIGDSKFSAGISFAGSWDYFDLTEEVIDGQSDYSVGVFPFAEYAISDRFQLRSVVGFIGAHIRGPQADTGREPDDWTFVEYHPYQTLGLGTVITRDIYLYTFLKMDLHETSTETTRLNFYVRFNFF